IPEPRGANLMRTLQLPPPASVVMPDTHSPAAGVSWVKPEFEPVVRLTVMTLEACWPVLVMTKVSSRFDPITTFPKLAVDPVAGARVSLAPFCALPASEAAALPPGVAVTETEALLLPEVLGANATTTLHIACAASVAVQSLDRIVKSAMSVRVSADKSPVVVP